ncbi:MAG: hypothetical protein ACI83W_000820 [Marinoscillum sp.]|jgi:hypothetical protein
MKNLILILLLALIYSCTGVSEKPSEWEGEWKALWETDPASFEGIEGITDFTMPGKITFLNDSVTIKAFGFEGCVFSKDTLDHSLMWKVSNDSLILINDESTPGMVYQIVEKGESKVRLQLMEDIFLTLTK